MKTAVLLLLAALSSAAVAAIDWQPCPVYTSIATGSSDLVSPCPGVVEQPTDLKAVCASVSLPLDPENGTPGNVSVFVKRVLAQDGPSKGNIFMLNGGPGDSGVLMECMVRNMTSTVGGAYDIIIPDHRGTGRSTPLTCGGGQANGTQACQFAALAKYTKSYLAAFSTTNAAHDVYELMTLTATPGLETLLYGVSYGTFWSQRLLHLYPDAPIDRIVLDGVVAPDVTRFVAYDNDVSIVGQALLDTCSQQSALCKTRLGAYPVYRLHLVHNLLKAGGANLPCFAALDGRFTVKALSYGLGSLLVDPTDRLGVAPVVARLLRCNSGDVAALNHLLSTMPPVGEADAVTAPSINASLIDNSLLGINIGVSELYDYKSDPLAPSTVYDMEESLLMTAGVGPQFTNAVVNGWPAYATPDYAYANTSIPILATNGDLDPQTEFDFAVWVTQHYPSSTLVRVPGAVHATAFPGRATPEGGTVPCGMLMAGSFLSTGTTNTSCLSALPPIDWDGSTAVGQATAMKLFGTPSLWD